MNLKKNLLTILIIVVIAILLGLMSELVVNFSYFKLNEAEKGVWQLKDTDLTMSQTIKKVDQGYAFDFSTQVEENGVEFGFLNPSYIIDLEMQIDENSGPFTITVDNGGKDYWGTKTYQITPKSKNKIILSINGNANDTKIFLKPDESTSNQENRITKIEVDNTFDFNWNLFILITSFSFLIGLLIYYRKYFFSNLDKTFLLLALVFGLNSAILMPNYFSWDEREHFVKAYQIGSFDLGIENEKAINWPDNIEDFYYFDGKTAVFDTYDEKEDYYRQFDTTELSLVEYIHSTAASYMPTAYIPAALGILVAKVFNLPFWMIFYAGRISNLLVYAFIISRVIKYVPCFKKTFFALGLLPTQIMLAGAYSADPMTNTFALVLMGLFITMKKSKEQISLKMIGLFVVTAGILCTCKMTYLPLFLLLFLIPNNQIVGFGQRRDIVASNKEQKKNGIRVKVICCGVIGLVLLVNLIYSKTHGLAQWPLPGVNPKGQLMFILTNPLEYVVIFLNYIQSSALSYIQGNSINFAYTGMLPEIYILLVIGGISALALLDDSDQLVLSATQKTMVAGIILLAWGATVTALYITFNSVGSISVLGVQGRYFAPLLFPTMLLFKSKNIQTTFNTVKMNCIVAIISSVGLLALVSKLFLMYSL